MAIAILTGEDQSGTLSELVPNLRERVVIYPGPCTLDDLIISNPTSLLAFLQILDSASLEASDDAPALTIYVAPGVSLPIYFGKPGRSFMRGVVATTTASFDIASPPAMWGCIANFGITPKPLS